MAINNKGITTVEVLLCFVLIVVITTSLYSTISAFNDKRLEEKNRSKIINYTNILTKTIQDDLIFKGLAFANITERKSGSMQVYEVNMTLNDGTKRLLRISQQFTKSQIHLDGDIGVDDSFVIEYGDPDNKMELYPLPDLGNVKGKYQEDDMGMNTFVPCGDGDCRILQNLQINNVLLDISNENKNYEVESHVLSIFIGLYHPDLGNRYAVNINAPINYHINSASSTLDSSIFSG